MEAARFQGHGDVHMNLNVFLEVRLNGCKF